MYFHQICFFKVEEERFRRGKTPFDFGALAAWPGGIFSYQKSQFGYILEVLGE
jgi:hypothetical protein